MIKEVVFLFWDIITSSYFCDVYCILLIFYCIILLIRSLIRRKNVDYKKNKEVI